MSWAAKQYIFTPTPPGVGSIWGQKSEKLHELPRKLIFVNPFFYSEGESEGGSLTLDTLVQETNTEQVYQLHRIAKLSKMAMIILDESMTFNSVLQAIRLIAMRRDNNIVW